MSRPHCVALLAASLALLPQFPTVAQEIPRIPASVSSGVPQAPLAVSGEPFGVLQAELPLPPGWLAGEPRVLVEDDQGRVFYPVVRVRSIEVVEVPPPPVIGRRGGLLDRVRSAVRGEPKKRQQPVALSIAALFRGASPLELKLVGDVNQRIRITPDVAVAGTSHARLLEQWWTAYTRSASDAVAGDDFPKLVHKYLTAMLSQRLQLPAVDLDPPAEDGKELAQPLQTLSLLAAIEPLREQILEEVLTAPGDAAQTATLPVPPDPIWEPTILPANHADVDVEALAQRVPPECFYLRFGSFANYVWFQELAERFGGDIAQAVMLRGFNYEASARMERMLATKMTTLAKLFGDKLIGDMAVIGSDLYMTEGASLGVLFFATNPGLLNSSIGSDRKAALAQHPDATLSEVIIAGKPVSLLSTPDNRIRSFYVSDGPYIFVSTSRTLVRRFLEVGGGDTSLADTPAFRWARTWMPNANQYAVFGYLSPDFFHRLVSPQYQIELRRRLRAIAQLEIAQVAQQVATAEGMSDFDLPSLQAAGLLPPWFDQRPDGAQTLRSDQRWIDSLRGGRGSFLPIADVELRGVSVAEAQEYEKIANFYRTQWGRMDPMLVGLRRFRGEDPRAEQVALEAYVAPFEPDKYGWIARQLGPPTPVELQLPADDAASLQLHLKGANVLGIVSQDYHLFAGVKDMIPPDAEDTKGLIKTLQALRATPGYLGAWPMPGIIEQLPLGLGLARPDYAGFSRMIGGLWRWTNGSFSLLSFDRSIIENAIPQLQPLAAPDLAQARLRVADLTGSQLSSWINRKWYERGWRASHGNARLLDAMHQQLKVPGEECLDVAQRLFDVRLQCPVGGQYQFQPLPGTAAGGWWESTAWPAMVRDAKGRPSPPATYSAPWIGWFRGGRAHLTQGAESLSLVGSLELELQPLAAQATPATPDMIPAMDFDLFSLPMKLFGNSEGKAEDKPQRKSF